MVNSEDIRVASEALGRQMATYRRAVGLSQGAIAPLLSYSRSTIANAETGRQLVNRGFWEAADHTLNADGALLSGYDELQALIRKQHQDKTRAAAAARTAKYRNLPPPARTTTRPAAQAASAAVGADPDNRSGEMLGSGQWSADRPTQRWARLAYALTHPEHLDEYALGHLAQRTEMFFRRADHDPTLTLAAELREHLHQLTFLLDEAPDRHRPRLLTILGETHAVAGWVAWHTTNTTQADQHYQHAHTIARQAGDQALTACVLIYRSHLAETLGQLTAAHQHTLDAQHLLTDPAHAATRSWAATREAEIAATLGNQTAALHALHTATIAYDYAQPQRERAWTHNLTPALLAAATVTVHTRLSHPPIDSIVQAALDALTLLDLTRKTIALADTATAATRAGHYDYAAQLGHEALGLATSRTNRLITERLHHLHRAVKDTGDTPTLATLHDRLTTHTS